jgi:Domain of unknown function (DUF4260)
MASSTSVQDRSGQVLGARDSVVVLLRLEGLAVAALTLVFYARSGQSWWLFAAVWLVPDLSMLGYLYSPCWGARIYNAVHTYVLPAVLVLFALVFGTTAAVIPFALIWINHIAVDRLLGFGLKYSNGFGWTHLGRAGSQDAERA